MITVSAPSIASGLRRTLLQAIAGRLRRSAAVAIAFIGCLCATSVVATPDTRASVDPLAPNQVSVEQRLELLVTALQAGRFGQSRRVAADLVAAHPDFRLGQLLYAEMLAASIGDASRMTGAEAWSPALIELMLEARVRIQRRPPVPATDKLPDLFINAGRHLAHVVAVDLAASRMYLFDNTDQGLVLRREHYVSSGLGGPGKRYEGDLKTPIGVYRIARFRSDARLPELYGSGALTLNYPNTMDRLFRRRGSGIWLHGVPRSSYNRSPYSSEGCVVMSNDLLLDLHEHLNTDSTLVVLAEHLDWRSREQLGQKRLQHEQRLGRWLERQQAPVVASGGTRQVAGKSGPSIPLSVFERLQSRDITFMHYPVQPDPVPGAGEEFIMMQFTLPSVGSGETPAKRVTIYWRENAAGEWEFVRESIETMAV